jgi:hypothetical protein
MAARSSYQLDAPLAFTPAANHNYHSQEPVFLIRVPIRLFLLKRRGSRLSPKRVVPGDCLQSIVAGLKDHRRIGRFALHLVELDGDLAPGIRPMSKRGNGAFAEILGHRGRSIRTEAYAECWPGGAGSIRRIRRFRTVDTGVLRDTGECGGRDQRQYNRDAGYCKLQMRKFDGSHNVFIIAPA